MPNFDEVDGYADFAAARDKAAAIEARLADAHDRMNSMSDPKNANQNLDALAKDLLAGKSVSLADFRSDIEKLVGEIKILERAVAIARSQAGAARIKWANAVRAASMPAYKAVAIQYARALLVASEHAKQLRNMSAAVEGATLTPLPYAGQFLFGMPEDVQVGGKDPGQFAKITQLINDDVIGALGVTRKELGLD